MPARRAALVALLLAAPAAAQRTLAPEAFEALAEGHTLHFALDGVPFGAERYFPGRRSLWRFEDGGCEAGVWWPDGDRICFDYGTMPPQCWRFRRTDAGLEAALVENGAEPGFALRLTASDDAPLDCPGPDVGS